jgi:hypothetical protein
MEAVPQSELNKIQAKYRKLLLQTANPKLTKEVHMRVLEHLDKLR